MKGGDCFSNYFLILVLIVFFMLLYVYAGSLRMNDVYPFFSTSKEMFGGGKDNELLSVDKIRVIQGNAIPNKETGKIEFDQNDPSTQSVDGSDKTPKSMFMFAYNKCDIKCCGDSPYSCNGGCVCLTNEQKRYLSNRGYNNRQNKCSVEEY